MNSKKGHAQQLVAYLLVSNQCLFVFLCFQRVVVVSLPDQKLNAAQQQFSGYLFPISCFGLYTRHHITTHTRQAIICKYQNLLFVFTYLSTVTLQTYSGIQNNWPVYKSIHDMSGLTKHFIKTSALLSDLILFFILRCQQCK